MKVLAVFGRPRKRSHVRVLRMADGSVLVRWREGGRRQERYPDTRDGRDEATAFAEGTHERLTKGDARPAEPLTVRQLWRKYALAEFDHLRPRTQQIHAARWRKFETIIGRHVVADAISHEVLDEYKGALRQAGHTTYQVGLHLQIVKSVFRWGVGRELVGGKGAAVPLYRFRIAKEDRKRITIAEFRGDDHAKLLSHFDPRDSRAWRMFVLLTLLGEQGPRARAALHLRWPDVDFEARTLRWAPEYDKMGHERTQPMTTATFEALLVAYGWALAMGYTGPWVFPGGQRRTRGLTRDVQPSNWEKYDSGYVSAAWRASLTDEEAKRHKVARGIRPVVDRPWSYVAFHRQLTEAERSLGIPHIRYRAAHGFRRMAAGDTARMTGNPKDGMDWIGDKDMRQAPSYLLERDDELRAIAEQKDARRAKEGV